MTSLRIDANGYCVIRYNRRVNRGVRPKKTTSVFARLLTPPPQLAGHSRLM